jgi:hypothetical protein
VDTGLKQYKSFKNANEKQLDLEITSESNFTMHLEGERRNKEYNPINVVCVPKKKPIVKPVAWKITEERIKGNLLVFHLLPQSATFISDGGTITKEHPNGPKCDLFVRFVSFYINFVKTSLIFF